MPHSPKHTPKVQVEWIDAHAVAPTHANLSVTQVYGWIVSANKRVVLVSKDGREWQLPGGKPEPMETPVQTLYRETYEETGIDRVTLRAASPRMFGYRKVAEDGREYLQVRYFVSVNAASSSLELSPTEDASQNAADVVRHAKWVTLPEAERLVPWLHDADEYHAFLQLLSDQQLHVDEDS